MSDDRLTHLADLPLSYPEVGATGTALPDGYRHVGRDVVVGAGGTAFAAAGRCLMSFDMHRGAGFSVSATADRAMPGVDVLLRRGPTWLPGNEAPCRVLHTVDQPDRVGFTYGTLRGHPLHGEESFSVLLDESERVRFVLIAFSRPATPLLAVAGPLGRALQDRIADRYAAALGRVAA